MLNSDFPHEASDTQESHFSLRSRKIFRDVARIFHPPFAALDPSYYLRSKHLLKIHLLLRSVA
jgi:hypothetical protein